MKIGFLPLYDENGASSRLRVYTLHRELLKLGHDSRILKFYEDQIEWLPDVLVVQKHRDPKLLTTFQNFKGISIYDFDDTECNDVLPTLNVSLVTTDTQIHLDQAPLRAGQKAAVIADPIDFCPDAPLARSEGKYVCWFGHQANLTPRVEAKLVEIAAAGYEVLQVNWRSDFAATLRQYASCCFLSHAGQDQGKSNNKALLALAQGIPVIGHASVAYRDLLEDAANDSRSYVYLDDDLIENIKFAHSDMYPLDELQRYIFNYYHPSFIAKSWLAQVQACR